MISEVLSQYRSQILAEGPNIKARKLVEKAHTDGSLHPVVEQLIEIASSADPKSHPKRLEMGLGFEGGGMAGAVSCYEGAALEMVGWAVFGIDIIDCFKVIAGSSSGATNAGYLMRRRLFYGKDAYENHLSGPPFLNNPFSRKPPFINLRIMMGLRKSPFVNLDHLFDLMRQDELGHPDQGEQDTKLAIISTNADRTLPGTVEARRLCFDFFQDQEDFISANRGSTHLPLLNSLRPYKYRKYGVYDGGLVEHIAANTLVDRYGCSKVLVLTSFPKDAIKHISAGEKVMAILVMGIQDPGLTRLWLTRIDRLNQTRRWLVKQQQLPSESVQYFVVAPSNGANTVKTMETDKSKIRSAGISGAYDVFKSFGINDPTLKQELTSKMFQYNTA